jgi:hypothetical protein
MLIGINVCVTQLLWFKKIRSNLWALFIIGLLINCGMWSERFVIVVGSLYQDFLPANWGKYMPTIWDIGLYVGTLGAFFMLYLLFVKFLPVIAIPKSKASCPKPTRIIRWAARRKETIHERKNLRPHRRI